MRLSNGFWAAVALVGFGYLGVAIGASSVALVVVAGVLHGVAVGKLCGRAEG